MSPRRHKRSGPKPPLSSRQNQIIVLLLAIVIFQSFLILRSYLKEPSQSGPKTRKPVPIASVQSKKLKPQSIPKQSHNLALPKKISTPRVSSIVPEEKSFPPQKPLTKSRYQIAIIIDDSGYNIRDCEFLRAIEVPLTVSILPDLTYSTDIAHCAHENDKEVMLHLPLEPYVNTENYPDNYIIKTSMPKELILNLIKQSLKGIPYASGVNNHMGSKATENTYLMSIIFQEMAKFDLYFVDSRVTDKSVCRRLTAKLKIPFAERDVFLDNNNDRVYIEKQFRILVRKARQKGRAIAIGHARDLTWQIVKEQTEKLSKEGFEFVTVKSMISSLTKN